MSNAIATHAQSVPSSSSSAASSSKARTAARLLLGLVFFASGVNGLLGLYQPAEPPQAGAFLGALAGVGYFFPLLKVLEVLAGAALLANRFVPLALAVLAPIVVNVFAFHAFLAPAGLPVAALLLALELFLAWSYRRVYRPMLAAQVSA